MGSLCPQHPISTNALARRYLLLYKNEQCMVKIRCSMNISFVVSILSFFFRCEPHGTVIVEFLKGAGEHAMQASRL